jgi:outer membrane protein TolC
VTSSPLASRLWPLAVPAAARRLCALAAAVAFAAGAQQAPPPAQPPATQPAPSQQAPAQPAPEKPAPAPQPAAPAAPESAKAQGLTLPELITRARQQDPRALQAQAQLVHAQAKRDEVWWAWFPSFETTIGAGGPTPEAYLNKGSTDSDLTDVTPGSMARWGQLGIGVRAQVSATLPFYTFGKLSNANKAAEHGVGFADAMHRRAQDQAALDLTRAFWGYQTAHAGILSIDNVRKRLEDAQKTAKRLIAEKSDQLTRTDALKIDFLKEEIEAQHASAIRGERVAFEGIRALAGFAPDEALAVARRDVPPPPEMPDSLKSLEVALEQRPEMRAAREGLAARERLVDVARASLYPDLALVGGGTFAYTSNASNPPSPFAYNPYHERTAFIALGLKVTFDIPQKLARIRQAEADLQEAQALARGAIALIRVEVNQALAELQEARTRVERYAHQTAIGKTLVVKASIAFDAGLGDTRELLEDTLLYSRADVERLRGLLDAQIAWASLQKAMGLGP